MIDKEPTRERRHVVEGDLFGGFELFQFWVISAWEEASQQSFDLTLKRFGFPTGKRFEMNIVNLRRPITSDNFKA